MVTDVAYCIPMTTLLFSTKRNNYDDDDGKRMKSNNNIVKFRFNIIICNMQSKSTSSLICNMLVMVAMADGGVVVDNVVCCLFGCFLVHT